jgi:hypothetical protein
MASRCNSRQLVAEIGQESGEAIAAVIERELAEIGFAVRAELNDGSTAIVTVDEGLLGLYWMPEQASGLNSSTSGRRVAHG